MLTNGQTYPEEGELDARLLATQSDQLYDAVGSNP